MLLDVARLVIGITLMAFHRPVADFFTELDHSFTALLHTRGLRLPSPPRPSTLHTLYFCLGMLVCVCSMFRIYSALPH